MSCKIDKSNKNNPIRVTHQYCPGAGGSFSFGIYPCKLPKLGNPNNLQNPPRYLDRHFRFGYRLERIFPNPGWHEFGPVYPAPLESVVVTPNLGNNGLSDTQTAWDNNTYPLVYIQGIGFDVVSTINDVQHVPFTTYTFNQVPPGKYKLYLASDVTPNACVDSYEFEIKDLSAIKTSYDIELSGDCNNKIINVKIHAEGYGNRFRYLLRGADVVEDPNFDLASITNIFNNTTAPTVFNNGNFYDGSNTVPNNFFQVKNTGNFTLVETATNTDLPFDSWAGPGGAKFRYDIWVRQDNCDPIKIGEVNTNQFIKPEYTVAIHPGSFSCGKSNCDGFINVSLIGENNFYAPYSVNAFVIDTETNKAVTKAIKPLSAKCDESCGYSIKMNTCAINEQNSSNDIPFAWKVQVFDKFGCPIKRVADNNKHSPEAVGTTTEFYQSRDIQVVNELREDDRFFNAFEDRQINYIQLIPSEASCINCCDSYITRIEYYNKFNRLIYAERVSPNLQTFEFSTNGINFTTPNENTLLPNYQNRPELCGLYNLHPSLQSQFLVRLTEHPSNFRNPGPLITPKILGTWNQINNKWHSLFTQLIELGLFSNLCSGKYCYELSIVTEQVINDEAGQLTDNNLVSRKCECVINFCVDIPCPQELKVVNVG
jgi:hypothetical protein